MPSLSSIPPIFPEILDFVVYLCTGGICDVISFFFINKAPGGVHAGCFGRCKYNFECLPTVTICLHVQTRKP